MTTVKSNKSIQNLFNNKRTCVDSGRLFSHHRNSIILILKYTCVEFISIKPPTMGKSNQKIEKRTIILVFEKVTRLAARALVAVRKKK